MNRLFSNQNHEGTGQPWMVYTLMGLNVLFYVLQLVNSAKKQANENMGGSDENSGGNKGRLSRLLSSATIENMALIPKELFQTPSKELPTTIFSMFSHANLPHLLFNMLALYKFGRPIEDEIGSLKTLLIYIISGVGANLLYTLFNPNSEVGLIGASGAISGLSAAYFLHFAETRNMTAWLMYQLSGLLLARQSGVSYSSHLMGFAIGAITYLLMQNADEKKIAS